jgi:hypothetical protein
MDYYRISIHQSINPSAWHLPRFQRTLQRREASQQCLQREVPL